MSQDSQFLTAAELPEIRDFYLPLNNDMQDESIEWYSARAFTGSSRSRLAFGKDPDVMRFIREAQKECLKHASTVHDTARINILDQVFRMQIVNRTENRRSVHLRRIPRIVPTLEEAGVSMAMREILMADTLIKGGLILITGTNGQGKTTVLSSTIVHRLRRHGGAAQMIEDPSEYPCDGVHGDGVCLQLPVSSDIPSQNTYEAALKKSLRAFPAISGGGTMLGIGEIRDKETAAEALKQSGNGHLVVATMHGQTIVQALDRLVTMASEVLGTNQARMLLGTNLRMICNQSLVKSMTQRTVSSEASWFKSAEVSAVLLFANEADANMRTALTHGDQIAIEKAISKQSELLSSYAGGPVSGLIKQLGNVL